MVNDRGIAIVDEQMALQIVHTELHDACVRMNKASDDAWRRGDKEMHATYARSASLLGGTLRRLLREHV